MKCTNLSKSYGKNAVLKSVSLELSKDHITVLRGHSGCGKTTLLRCLALLEKSDSGQIFVSTSAGYEDVTPSENGALYPKLSIVFQQLFLWPHLSCRENIELVSTDRVYSEELAERLGVSDVMSRRPNEVSLGQRQRVAIIRALSFRPSILLVDEITSALDRQNTKKVAALLNELLAEGTKILCVTHDDFLANEINNKTLLMEHGRLIDT